MAETERKIVVEFGGDPEPEERDLNWKGPDQRRKDPTAPKSSVINFKNLVQGGYAYNLGRQVFSTATGRIGQYTGNYILQNQINNVLTGVTLATGILSGNPVAIIGSLLQIGVSAIDLNTKITQSNVEATSIQRLTGISATLRSRGNGVKL